MSLIDEQAPGGVGLLIDETPLLDHSSVRPYVVATLLHRGAVRYQEILACLIPHCSPADLKVGAWDPIDEEYCDNTRLEKLVDEVLGEFVSERILRYNEEQGLWVLTANDISRIISWVASLGSRMPKHLLQEMSKEQFSRIPSYVKFQDYDQQLSNSEP